MLLKLGTPEPKNRAGPQILMAAPHRKLAQPERAAHPARARLLEVAGPQRVAARLLVAAGPQRVAARLLVAAVSRGHRRVVLADRAALPSSLSTSKGIPKGSPLGPAGRRGSNSAALRRRGAG